MYILLAAFGEIESSQNPQQKGFTKGRSLITAVILFKETLAGVQDTKTTLTPFRNVSLIVSCIDYSICIIFIWRSSPVYKGSLTSIFMDQSPQCYTLSFVVIGALVPEM